MSATVVENRENRKCHSQTFGLFHVIYSVNAITIIYKTLRVQAPVGFDK